MDDRHRECRAPQRDRVVRLHERQARFLLNVLLHSGVFVERQYSSVAGIVHGQKGEHDRLQARIHAMYVDKLDGHIDAEFFDRMSAEWRAEQGRCLREIERHGAADQSYLEEGGRVLELANNARRLFDKQEPREKRRLLNFLVSNCSWKSGDLTVSLRQPFDLLAETKARAMQIEDPDEANSAKRPEFPSSKDLRGKRRRFASMNPAAVIETEIPCFASRHQ